ncbi:hypothetical protein D3C71_1505980 [compost metagenome]
MAYKFPRVMPRMKKGAEGNSRTRELSGGRHYSLDSDHSAVNLLRWGAAEYLSPIAHQVRGLNGAADLQMSVKNIKINNQLKPFECLFLLNEMGLAGDQSRNVRRSARLSVN